MKEVFYEESAVISNAGVAKVKYNIFKGISIASYVLMVIWISIIFLTMDLSQNLILNLIFYVVPLVLFFLSGFLFGRFKNKLYVDYDYTFVTGSIRIAKVIKNIKRKFVLKFDASNIEKIGKYASGTFNKYNSMPGVTKYTFTSNITADEGKEFYYIVANVDGDKKLMIFECTETFIVHILKFANKSVLEEEFTRK
jgi:hypothetical protein